MNRLLEKILIKDTGERRLLHTSLKGSLYVTNDYEEIDYEPATKYKFKLGFEVHGFAKDARDLEGLKKQFIRMVYQELYGELEPLLIDIGEAMYNYDEQKQKEILDAMWKIIRV